MRDAAEADATARRAGFVGLGALGRPIAERLAVSGHALVLHDRRPEAAAALAGPEAIAAHSAREVADRAAIVFGCVATPDEFRDVVLGPQGLVQGAALRVYVHLGTSGAPLLAEIAEALAARGIATLDAPVAGGPPRARAGTLTTMVSGPDAALQAAEPLMRSYSGRIVRLGPQPGAAQVMKLLNNAVTLANLAAACEAMAVGARAGLRAEDMLEVLTSGSAQSDAQTAKIRDHVLTGRFAFGGSLDVVIKDLALFHEAAAGMGQPAAIAGAVLEAYRTAARLGAGTDDLTRVVRSFAPATGPDGTMTGWIGPGEECA
jgi:3-hydroxyisobutyrate dehydrogenase-like beta-hydroxyacid dehydrogenase